MTEALHLVRLVLDRRALARVATRHHLSPNIDDGYLIHAGLAQLFARSAEPADVPLHSFAVDDVYAESRGRPELLYLLGYSSLGDRALEAQMGDARGEILRLCKTNDVPAFQRGQRAGFRIRVCPIVRTRVPGRAPLRLDIKGRTQSREIDAFIHATLGVSRETPVSREAVYVDWLRKNLEAKGACSLEAARLAEFRREVMRRKGGGGPIERPNAVLEGTLTITDPAAFAALLARGVGRHRAFGFGMLLLRPAAAR